jgi:Tfp pilus assembly protein PilF
MGASDPQQLYDLANAQLAARDFDAAILNYRGCVTSEPGFAPAYNNLGSALLEVGRFEEAADVLEVATRLSPAYIRPLVNLGKALRELGRLDDAVARLEEALSLQPQYVSALVNLGDVLIARDELTRAHEILSRAAALAPTLAMAHASLGVCELQLGQIDRSLATLQRASALEPHNRKIAMTLAHASFLTGDWREGWRFFRAYCEPVGAHLEGWPTGMARWDGRLGSGAALALVSEQGLGDTIQFARYGDELRRRGHRTTLIAQRPLVPLLELSGLFDRVVAAGDELEADACFPLLGLPEVFGTAPTSVPLAQRYLTADPQAVIAWRSRLECDHHLRVGIAWQGNVRAERGLLLGRSPGLAPFEVLTRLPHVALFSLQKGPGESELQRQPFGHHIRVLEGLDERTSFVDSAAVIASLDLVITSDTSIAHLAGALGRPVWVCLHKHADWRWGNEPRSAWYASARLFRQARQGDWGAPFSEMAAALASDTPALGH